VEYRLHEQGAAGLVKAYGHIGAQALTQHQYRLEVLQIEGDVCGLTGVVPVVQKHLSCVDCQLRVERLLRVACTRMGNAQQLFTRQFCPYTQSPSELLYSSSTALQSFK